MIFSYICKKKDIMGYHIKEYVSDRNGCIIGVIVVSDNGDSTYMSMLDYQNFVNNRIKNGFKTEDGNKA
jgi:hypothetical protein